MAVVIGAGFTQLPAAISITNLKTEVARYVKLPSNTEALTVSEDGIKDGIRRLNSYMWFHTRTTQTVTVVASTATYTLTGNFKAPHHAALLDASAKSIGSLGWLNPKEMESRFPARDTDGNPTNYTCFNYYNTGKMELNAPPGAAWATQYPSILLRYYARIVYPSGSDGLDAPTEVEGFILWNARAYVATHYQPQKYNIARQEAELRLKELRRSSMETEHSDWDESWPA